MSESNFDQRIRQVMSGESRGAGAGGARVALSAGESLYRVATGVRNRLFDRGWLAAATLPRPVISIGNLTTGGTGKTPVVQWLARRLLSDERRPAVLMRGYRRDDEAGASDEELVLRESLPDVGVHANPDRVAAGLSAVAADPTIDAFILDDGFQHRRLARDVDVVLIDATNPFGYGHVLPRGMLREDVSGVRRAHLVIVTRARSVDGQAIAEIERVVRRFHPAVPIVRADAALDAPIDVNGDAQPTAKLRILAFSGIGNPQAFERSLVAAGMDVVATRRFADHHHYTDDDVLMLRVAALDANADAMITTEKDWVKIRHVDPAGPGVETWRVGMRVEFIDDGERVAWQTILAHAGLPYRSPRAPRRDDDLWTE